MATFGEDEISMELERASARADEEVAADPTAPADAVPFDPRRDPAGPLGFDRPFPTDSAARKEYPIVEGLLDYFPDACAEVAHVSFVGNEKHNPGQPMHWARGKSSDHANCTVRHVMQRGGFDTITAGGKSYRIRHAAEAAWRALALCQEEIEREKNLPPSRGSK